MYGCIAFFCIKIIVSDIKSFNSICLYMQKPENYKLTGCQACTSSEVYVYEELKLIKAFQYIYQIIAQDDQTPFELANNKAQGEAK